MNPAILWKEYRQQRWILAAIFVLALLIPLLLVGMSENSISIVGWQAFLDQTRPALAILLVGLALTFGVVSGALVLAGEKEEGTLAFLDYLSARRAPLWIAKAKAAFALTFTQGLLLGVLLLGLDAASWEYALLLPFAGLDALACGLLGGALCRIVLLAVIAGIGALAVNWSISFLLGSSATWMIWKLGLAVVEIAVSWRIYCEPDVARRTEPHPVRFKLGHDMILLWLTIRQGRWIMLGLFLGALILGPMVNLEPLILWPTGTFFVGLICGLAVFAPEQSGRQETFLGAQRLPLGRIWAEKTITWGLTALGTIALAWVAALLTFTLRGSSEISGQLVGRWFSSVDALDALDPLAFLTLWVVHGFCLGLFFGTLCRRPIIAAILASLIGLTIGALWMPSVLFGGLALWQLLGLPVILLIAARVAMRPWVSGRLYELRPLFMQIGLSLVAVGWLVGGVWYRVAEVPDVGEPFDMQAFEEGIPPPEKNVAGKLIHEAAADLREQYESVDARVAAPTKPAFEGVNADFKPVHHQYRDFASDVIEKGWPSNDGEFVIWFDAMMAGKWVKKAHDAARLPLGVVDDPRRLNSFSLMTDVQTTREFASLLAARSIQRQTQGKFKEALEDLETVLGLSRQVRNHSPTIYSLVGLALERTAVTGLERWLQAVGPNVELLKKAQAMMEFHQANMPDLLDPYRAEYLIVSNTSVTDYLKMLRYRRDDRIQTDLLEFAWQVPWEKERRRRLASGHFQEAMRLHKTPYWEVLAQQREVDSKARGINMHSMSGFYWTQYVLSLTTGRRYFPPVSVRGGLLITALARYQAEQGKAAKKLDDLVPRYLPALPIDPYSGKPFQYRVWVKQENPEPAPVPGANEQPNWKDAQLLDGQTYVWSDGEAAFRPEYSGHRVAGFLFIVPLWNRK